VSDECCARAGVPHEARRGGDTTAWRQCGPSAGPGCTAPGMVATEEPFAHAARLNCAGCRSCSAFKLEPAMARVYGHRAPLTSSSAPSPPQPPISHPAAHLQASRAAFHQQNACCLVSLLGPHGRHRNRWGDLNLGPAPRCDPRQRGRPACMCLLSSWLAGARAAARCKSGLVGGTGARSGAQAPSSTLPGALCTHVTHRAGGRGGLGQQQQQQPQQQQCRAQQTGACRAQAARQRTTAAAAAVLFDAYSCHV
jgi:hypothetical protein